MQNTIDLTALRPRLATASDILFTREIETTEWPYDLRRFALFKRKMDGKVMTFRAISWYSAISKLYVLPVDANTSPSGGSFPIAWSCKNKPLLAGEIEHIPECIRPKFMDEYLKKKTVPVSCLKGLNDRNLIIDSLLMLDPTGEGISAKFIFNDMVIINPYCRSAAIDYICSSLGKDRNIYRSSLVKLLHKYLWFGGGPSALMNLGPRQGGPGISRVGVNKQKPGPLSGLETMALEIATFSEGNSVAAKRQRPIGLRDIDIFAAALYLHWATEKLSLIETYREILKNHYRKWSSHLIPTETMFYNHASQIIERDELKRIRNGEELTAQYDNARIGQAGDLTGGVIEILDVDGFSAKIRVAARVGGKIVPISIVVIFGVSRLSGVVLGYEIAVTGENAESFRRCIASAYTPKSDRAFQLGLDDTKGLLHGNIDAIFVDNGAGASESVIKIACDQMSLKRILPPPARGDLKGVGEGLNCIMVRLMANEKSGYTRGKDPLSKKIRRKKSKNPPIPLDDFERLLLKSINFYNLYTNKRRLRTWQMRNAGVGIAAASIFKYTQAQRRGDAARVLSVAELQDRFIPWLPRTCQKGLITFMKDRFTSTAMEGFFNEHAKANGDVENPEVLVKRVSGSPYKLLWKREDGVVDVLTMTDEDKRTHSATSWKGVDIDHFTQHIEDIVLKGKKNRNSGKVAVKDHDKLVAAERGRGNPLALLAGSSIKEARKNAKRFRDQEHGKLEVEAQNVRNDTNVSRLEVHSDSCEMERLFERGLYAELGLDGQGAQP